MLIKRPDDIPSSEITPESVYLDRRRFIVAAGAIGAGALLGCSQRGDAREADEAHGAHGADDVGLEDQPPSREEITKYDDATGYNNYYEFGTDKEDPKANAGSLRTRPWSVAVEGMVKRPATWALDDLLKGMTPQERVYRHRCVEAWSMVIPWLGVPLADVLRKLEPSPSAKFVELTTLHDPTQMPGQRSGVLPWPYVEGLRLD